MKKIVFFLTVFILFTATAQAQSSNQCNNLYSGVDVVRSCVNTTPAPPSSSCRYGGVNVCVREGTLRTDHGRVTVNPNRNNVIVNTARSNIDVSALLVNRGPYRSGDSIGIQVTLNQAVYLYIYNIDARNKTTMLFPNKYDSNNYIPSRGTVTFPRNNSYFYQLDNYTGTERIIVIASSNPNFNLSSTVNYQSPTSTFATNDNLATFGTDIYKGIEVITTQNNVSLKEWDTYTFTFRHQ